MIRTALRERIADSAISTVLALVAFAAAALMTSYLLGSHDWLRAVVDTAAAASGWLIVAWLVCLGLFFLLHAIVRGRWGLSPDRRMTVVDKRPGKALEDPVGGS